ncbi:unnamed protein product [Vitrella brassicaformis CCMP3155]|uniref:Protein kinase domain-containing protein n=1 Tax=Vitrella brassicaformis (strain CCMP3155) TaxID=1169540 RepID=A0A0G4EAB7_VITBC|nr:unnamed protein product [Vitrella brassicaformis CCMP3155]|eukprot:CEL92420.1 unnamed protein product [Vitrella brassicaformis CCMP3155]
MDETIEGRLIGTLGEGEVAAADEHEHRGSAPSRGRTQEGLRAEAARPQPSSEDVQRYDEGAVSRSPSRHVDMGYQPDAELPSPQRQQPSRQPTVRGDTAAAEPVDRQPSRQLTGPPPAPDASASLSPHPLGASEEDQQQPDDRKDATGEAAEGEGVGDGEEKEDQTAVESAAVVETQLPPPSEASSPPPPSTAIGSDSEPTSPPSSAHTSPGPPSPAPAPLSLAVPPVVRLNGCVSFHCRHKRRDGAGHFSVIEGVLVYERAKQQAPAILKHVEREQGSEAVARLLLTNLREEGAHLQGQMEVEKRAEGGSRQWRFGQREGQPAGVRRTTPQLFAGVLDVPCLRVAVVEGEGEGKRCVKEFPGSCVIMEKIGSGVTVEGFILDFMPEAIRQRQDERYCAAMASNVVRCLLALHRGRRLHGDLHARNVLVRDLATAEVAVIDFESTRQADQVERGSHVPVRTNPPAPFFTPTALEAILAYEGQDGTGISIPIGYVTDYVCVAWIVLCLSLSLVNAGFLLKGAKAALSDLRMRCRAKDITAEELRRGYQAAISATVADAHRRATSNRAKRAVAFFAFCCDTSGSGGRYPSWREMEKRAEEFIRETTTELTKAAAHYVEGAVGDLCVLCQGVSIEYIPPLSFTDTTGPPLYFRKAIVSGPLPALSSGVHTLMLSPDQHGRGRLSLHLTLNPTAHPKAATSATVVFRRAVQPSCDISVSAAGTLEVTDLSAIALGPAVSLSSAQPSVCTGVVVEMGVRMVGGNRTSGSAGVELLGRGSLFHDTNRAVVGSVLQADSLRYDGKYLVFGPAALNDVNTALRDLYYRWIPIDGRYMERGSDFYDQLWITVYGTEGDPTPSSSLSVPIRVHPDSPATPKVVLVHPSTHPLISVLPNGRAVWMHCSALMCACV